MRIPLVDLGLQHAQVADEIEAGFTRILNDSSFILGRDVAEFEERFAQFIGVAHCVGVANGTDSLELILRALDIGPGAEVIVPVNSFIATAHAVSRAGATPIFVDCDPEHYLIDPARVEERVSTRTRAIIPVHLYGQMADVEALESIAASADLRIVEDAAQAQGARRLDRPAGSIGIAAGTSFYPSKNLGAYGDAGAGLTDSESLAAKIRALRNCGGEQKNSHSQLGFNSRLDSLQAVVLNAKLRHLAAWNELRREAARRYDTLLEGLPGVQRPATLAGNEHVWYLYVIRVPERDALLDALNRAGVGAAVHYPRPIHLCGAYAEPGARPGSFPVAEQAASQLLSLPIFPGITAEQQTEISQIIADR